MGSMSLHRFTLALVGLTFGLLLLGSLVHATGSSLAFPDWPLCYGQVMPRMVGGVAVEHSHRLLASLVGLCTIVLAVVCWRRGGALRKASLAALALVIFQGVLGGVTVKLQLPALVSTAHLATSMIYFALLIWIAVKTRPGEAMPQSALRRWALAGAGAVYAQMIGGALVRH